MHWSSQTLEALIDHPGVSAIFLEGSDGAVLGLMRKSLCDGSGLRVGRTVPYTRVPFL